MQGNYRTEFPRFYVLGVDLPSCWIDISWGNDVCPSWAVPGAGLHIFIDYAARRHRESGGDRFTVYKVNAEGVFMDDEPLLHTECWNEVLHYVCDELIAAADRTEDPRAEADLRDRAVRHYLMTAEGRADK
jgi:hypothetical protein